MSDLQISKALALAIGWRPEQITHYEGQDYIGLPWTYAGRPCIKIFSYKFPSVIWPIAERYDAFPIRQGPFWVARSWSAEKFVYSFSKESPTAKAVALSVIGGAR